MVFLEIPNVPLGTVFAETVTYLKTILLMYIRVYVLTQPQSVIALYRLVAVLEIMFSNCQVHFLTFVEL